MKEPCREMLERAYLVLDGEPLSAADRAEMEGHLNECAPCFERAGIENEVKALIGRVHGCNPCPAELKKRIAGLLQLNDY